MPRKKKQILKQRPDGRYRAVYHGIEFYARTSDEALAARDEYIRAEKENRLVRRDQLTVLEYAIQWLPVHRASVKASTYNAYASILEHVLQPIAGTILCDLTSDDIAGAYSRLTGKSASYIHKARILVTAILDSATDAGYLSRNPARATSVKPPRGSAGTHRVITQEERTLIESVPHRMQLPAMIMLYAGLRRGEILALDASDITDVIHVRRAISYRSNQPIISAPKTEAGERRVPVLSVLKPFLSDLSGLVCKGTNGSYMTEQAWQCAWLSYQRTLSAVAGHPINIRPHDLRHSYCTMCVTAGVEPHQLMQWMGHADEKMILRIYDHVTAERTQKSVELLEKSLFQGQNEGQNFKSTQKLQ